ncbi:hypothetical protein MIDIC_310023 [Alphaproteobacteria bacterium]
MTQDYNSTKIDKAMQGFLLTIIDKCMSSQLGRSKFDVLEGSYRNIQEEYHKKYHLFSSTGNITSLTSYPSFQKIMQENKDFMTIRLVKSMLDGNIMAKLAFDEMHKNSEGLVLTNIQILENEKLKSEFIAGGATDGAVSKISANHWLDSGAFTEMWHKYQPGIIDTKHSGLHHDSDIGCVLTVEIAYQQDNTCCH